MNIPEIDSRHMLVNIVDELKYRLKARIDIGLVNDPMLEDFNDLLNEFIVRWGLAGDQHSFASLPKGDNEVRAKFVWNDGSIDFSVVDRRATTWKRFSYSEDLELEAVFSATGTGWGKTVMFRKVKYNDDSFEFVEC